MNNKPTILRESALSVLSTHDYTALKSEHFDAPAYRIQNELEEYTELVFLDGKWQLCDADGYLYSTDCLTLERLCHIVDGIVAEERRVINLMNE